MKRYKDIWETLCSYDNAVEAIIRGTEHKRKNRSVLRLLCNEKGELGPDKVNHMSDRLIYALKNGWKPSPYRHIQKRCKSTGKIREIDCPALFDHLIQWMLILAIMEPLTRGMYKYSCGSIPKRGIDYARKAIEEWTQGGDFEWFVKLDITKFYENVDRDVLKALFRRIIKDKRVLRLIDLIIDSVDKGLPIGSYTSQWFANFYLQAIDHYIKQDLYKERRGKRINSVSVYLRYMDDMLLGGASKRDLEKAIRALQAKLHDEYKLEIKNAWEIKNINEYPIDMVGYRFYKTHTVLRKRIFLKAKRLAKKIYRIKTNTKKIRIHDAQAMVSLIGWASHCDNKSFYKLHIKPYVKQKELKRVISYESRKQLAADRAV